MEEDQNDENKKKELRRRHSERSVDEVRGVNIKGLEKKGHE